MDIDEILERAEKVEEKGPDEEEGNELLSAFKASLSGYIYFLYMQAGLGKISSLYNIFSI